MDVNIRPVAAEDFEAFARSAERSFGEHARAEEIDVHRRMFEADRSVAAFDGAEIVGTAGAFSLSVTVPGGAMPMAGITAVGVSPTHRRRGILTRMMRHQLEDVHERGEPIAGLWASESSIYGRFGYGMAERSLSLEIERTRSAFARPREIEGRLRFAERDAAIPMMREVFDRVAPTRPGFWARGDGWWKTLFADLETWRDGASAYFYVLREGEHGVDGYVVYRIKGDWDEFPTSTLRVRELVASSREAYADLWAFVLGVDLMAKVEAWPRPLDEALPYLLAEPRRLRARIGDGLWVRVLDVAAALSGRGYRSEGRLVLEVSDGFCPWVAGRFELVAADGRARCGATGAEPDLRLDAATLGATFLGGARPSTLWLAGRIDGDQDAIRRADGMLGWHVEPWCPTVF